MSPPRKHTHARKVSHYQRFSLYHSNTPISFGVTAFAYTDVKDDGSKQSIAIEMLSNLDILKGITETEFRPEDTITRAQLAAVQFRLRSGGDASVGLYTPTADVAVDVPAGHWAAAYINWAKSLKIMAGDPDGKFRPDDKVTFAEVLTMTNRMLGYAEPIGNWPYNHIALAESNKLFQDIAKEALLADKEMSRGNVSIVARQALFTEAPAFSYTAVEGGTVVTKRPMLLDAAFNASSSKVVLSATSSYALANAFVKEGQVQFADGIGGFGSAPGGSFAYASNVDHLVGREVIVRYQNKDSSMTGGGSSAPTFTSGDYILSIEANSEEQMWTVNVNSKKQTNASGASIAHYNAVTDTVEFKVDGLDCDYVLQAGDLTSLGVSFSTPGVDVIGAAMANGYGEIKIFGTRNASTGVITGNAIYTESKATRVLFNDATAKKISTLDATLAGTSYTNTDGDTIVTLPEGIAKDDFVIVTAKKAFSPKAVAMNTVYTVAKADTKAGVVFSKHDSGKFYFDATSMAARKNPAGLDGWNNFALLTTGSNTNVTTADVGAKYNLHLTAFGEVFAVKKLTDTAAENYMLVKDGTASNSSIGGSSPISLTGRLPDGTTKTFNVSFKSGANGVALGATEVFDTASAGGWKLTADNLIRYSLDSNGAINEIWTVGTGAVGTMPSGTTGVPYSNLGSTDTYNKNTSVLTDGGSSYYVTVDTIVYIKTAGSPARYTVIKGNDLPTWTVGVAGTGILTTSDDIAFTYADSSKNVKALYIDITSGANLPVGYNNKYGLITNVVKTAGTSSNTFIYEVTAMLDGEKRVLKTASITPPSDLEDYVAQSTMPGYFEFILRADGTLEDVKQLDYTVSNTNGSWSRGVVARVFDNSVSLKVTDNNNIITINNIVNVGFDDKVKFYQFADASASDTAVDSIPDGTNGDIKVSNKKVVNPITKDSLVVGSTDDSIAYVVDYVQDNGKIVAVFAYAVPSNLSTPAYRRTLTIGAQTGALASTPNGTATFTVTGVNVSDGALTMSSNPHANLALTSVNLAGGVATITVTKSAAVPAGSYPFTVSKDGATATANVVVNADGSLTFGAVTNPAGGTVAVPEVTEVKGTWTVKIDTPLVDGNAITLDGTLSITGKDDGSGSIDTSTETTAVQQAAAIAALAFGDFTVAVDGTDTDTLVFTQKVGATGTIAATGAQAANVTVAAGTAGVAAAPAVAEVLRNYQFVVSAPVVGTITKTFTFTGTTGGTKNMAPSVSIVILAASDATTAGNAVVTALNANTTFSALYTVANALGTITITEKTPTGTAGTLTIS